MGRLDRFEAPWTAASFLVTDQRTFGNAWRYELVDGVVVAHATPALLHGEIGGNLVFALKSRIRGQTCKVEIGSGAAPKNQQRPTARIPDVLVRCEGLPTILFEIVSPSELRDWRERNRKRRDEQDVAGVQEIVEIYQVQPSIHVYRRAEAGLWSFESIDELDGVLHLASLDLRLPLSEIYENVNFDEPSDA
ncbi:MAG: Uma2 family endonuclease [Pseudomonadota bacterium]|nr:Uma2 family endonuclease [Pseudomonadota bacterium]